MFNTSVSTQHVSAPSVAPTLRLLSHKSTSSLSPKTTTGVMPVDVYSVSATEQQQFARSKARFDRSNSINAIKLKLQDHVGNIGLFGVTYGSVVGMSLATFATTSLLFVGAAANIFPGFGAVLFVSIFTLSIVVGATIQYIMKQRKNKLPEVQELYTQLQMHLEELQALDPEELTAQDKTDMANIIALQSHATWNWKNFGRQIGYGLLGIEPYSQAEKWFSNLFKTQR